ncbi:MAG: transcriptional regulator [Devosia sp.]|uniref:3'-5' exonuclease n=1 Tax=Devosia sp. TaxID=1871048 RepID=UPI0026234A2B|nr:exonuclease domain-containing protein [Devosia sp.]MDB5540611.1 transcriptional regulator [Devosia sp.]
MRVFLDFEASSLNKRSYPIEVGWVGEDGEGEAHLIRPAADWTDWDEAAEAVHGISRAQLMAEGEPHEAVCARLITLFDGNEVHASAPSWDGHWLSILLRAAGKPRHLLRLIDTEVAFVAAARERLGQGAEAAEIVDLVTRARAAVDAMPVAHRALEDARREWRVWREIRGL